MICVVLWIEFYKKMKQKSIKKMKSKADPCMRQIFDRFWSDFGGVLGRKNGRKSKKKRNAVAMVTFFQTRLNALEKRSPNTPRTLGLEVTGKGRGKG